MCGINGIVDYSGHGDISSFVRMNDALRHRGPDGEGSFVSRDKSVFLGNRRLSIVDMEGGNQPLSCEHKGNFYAITFNGEIYNYRLLRRELEQKGHQFSTPGDTEVLLQSYIEWGRGCLKRFNGQFAFAIYDGKSRKVFLARDRVGIKPLYYTQSGSSFLFSSEPKGLLAHHGVSRIPDHETIASYFIVLMTLTDCGSPPERSFYGGINALPPASYAFVDKDGLHKPQRFWELPFPEISPEQRLKGSKAVNVLRSALEEAVRIRIPSEVDFGTALSGGIDSSIVSLLSLRHSGKLTSATIGFLDDPDYRHARLLAKQKGI